MNTEDNNLSNPLFEQNNEEKDMGKIRIESVFQKSQDITATDSMVKSKKKKVKKHRHKYKHSHQLLTYNTPEQEHIRKKYEDLNHT